MTITLTAEDLPPRPARSHLQKLAWQRALAIRHGNRTWARRIEIQLAEAELWAAVDRYRSKAGSADDQLANQVASVLRRGA